MSLITGPRSTADEVSQAADSRTLSGNYRLDLGAVTLGKIGTQSATGLDDIDWYAIASYDPGTFRLTLSNDPVNNYAGNTWLSGVGGAAGIRLAITDGSGTLLASTPQTVTADGLVTGNAYTVSSGGDLVVTFTIPDSKTYYARLDTPSRAAGDYALRLDLIGGARIMGTAGGEYLLSGRGDDLLDGMGGDDTLGFNLVFGGGNDTLLGGPGNDILEVGKGADVLDGGQGTDAIVVDGAADLSAGTASSRAGGTNLSTVAAIENVFGKSNDDRITGSARANVLAGGEGADTLLGQAGADILFGGAGDDRLEGGSGDDLIEGGAGLDVAIYSGPSTRYLVTNGPGVGALTVRDLSGIDGVDTVVDVEVLQFAGFALPTTAIGYSPAGRSTPASITNARVFMQGNTFQSFNPNTQIYGVAGIDDVQLRDIVSPGSLVYGGVRMDQNIDAVTLSGAPGNYRFRQAGNQLQIYARSDSIPLGTVVLQVDADGTVLKFDGGQASARLPPGGIMKIGEATVSNALPHTLAIALSPITFYAGAGASGLAFLGAADSFTVGSGSAMSVFGNAGIETVHVLENVFQLMLDQNVDIVQFAEPAARHAFRQRGNLLDVFDYSGRILVATLAVQNDVDGTQLVFGTQDRWTLQLQQGGILRLGTWVVPTSEPARLPVAAVAREHVSISAAGSAVETPDRDTTYTVAAPLAGTYTYSISGFGSGDIIVGPTGITPSLINVGFDDGIVLLQYASVGSVVTVELTGLAPAQDLALFMPGDLNILFGAGTLA